MLGDDPRHSDDRDLAMGFKVRVGIKVRVEIKVRIRLRFCAS